MTFSSATYQAVSSWNENTLCKYVPGAKKGNTKSAERYEKYSQAKTIGEALQLGSKPEDLLNDYQKGFLVILDDASAEKSDNKPEKVAEKAQQKVTERAQEKVTEKVVEKASKPVEKTPEKARAADTPTSSLLVKAAQVVGMKHNPYGGGNADELLRIRQEKMTRTILLAKAVGLDLTDAKALREGGDTLEMMAERLVADRMAQLILEAVAEENRRVTNKEVHTVLQHWAFKRNEARQNVLPEGHKWVSSDTLGLVRLRNGQFGLTQATKEYPHVTQLLCTWLKGRRTDDFEGDFPATSISVNANYAARRHRDGNNAGPSAIHGFGPYTGGELVYWPDDDTSIGLDDLRTDEARVINISSGLALFDGNRAHEVFDFEGERFSIVFFSVGKFWTMTPEQRDYLIQCGFHVPEGQDLGPVTQLLPPPRGYTRCKSLASMFGVKEVEKAKVLQWTTEESEEEQRLADRIISSFSSVEVTEEERALAVEAAHKLVKLGKHDVIEEPVQVEVNPMAQRADADVREPSIAEMPSVKFGPLDQVFGRRGDATSKKEVDTGKLTPVPMSVSAPRSPLSSPLPTRQSLNDDLPSVAELSGEKKRARPGRKFGGGVDEPSLKKLREGGKIMDELSVPVKFAALGGNRLDSFSYLAQVLEAARQEAPRADALTNYFRLVLHTSDDPEMHMRAVLELLAPSAGMSEGDCAKLLSESRRRHSAEPATPLTMSDLAQVWGSRAADVDDHHVRRLSELMAKTKPEEAQVLSQLLVGSFDLPRSATLRALATAFALSRPLCKKTGRPAEARAFSSEDARDASLASMERAVSLAFGDLGGSCDDLISVLMANGKPADVFARCLASCGTPILPMAASQTSDAELALLKFTGSAVAFEQQYVGQRVQIHRLGDCVAIYGPRRLDIRSTFSERQLSSLRAALKVKACVVEAVLQRVGDVTRFLAFDCLWLNGRSLTRQSLRTRRAALSRAVQCCDSLRVVPQEEFSIEDPPTSEDVASLLKEAQLAGAAGLVVKRLEGEYEAGCSSASWLAIGCHA